MKNRIELIKEDITKLNVDAIVNAANTTLLGGGGVDGVIHKKAGLKLLEYCKKLNGCKTGEAKITPGFDLLAKYIIHTPGPFYKNGKYNEKKLLKNSYINSLILCVENNIKTVAFPNISTGVYRFPKEEAANIAIKTVTDFLKDNNVPEKVFFVCFDKENFNIYINKLKSIV